MDRLIQASKKLYSELYQQDSLISIAQSLPFDFIELTNENQLPTFLKIGNLLTANSSVYYPALLPLNQINGLAFKLNQTNRDEIHLAIQNYVFQMLSRSPMGIFEIYVFDAKKLGANFRLIRRLGKSSVSRFVADSNQATDLVSNLQDKSRTIIAECLTRYATLGDYNKHSGYVHPYRILLLGDFPHGCLNELEQIHTLITNAKESGLFVFMSYEDTNLTGSKKSVLNKILNELCLLEEFGNPANDHYKIKSESVDVHLFNSGYTLQLDRSDIGFDKLSMIVSSLESSNELTYSRQDGLRIPIGKSSGQTHFLTLGLGSDTHHAIIGGQSGKGKTVLLNNILGRGIELYSPDELRFVLIDCSGTGFHEFDDAIHIQRLHRSSDPESCQMTVEFIEQELVRRETLFKEAGVPDLRRYITKTQKILPRLLCMIDEFHVLYSGKERLSRYFDTILVDRVIRIGRKFGVHLILSTQSLGGGVRRSLLDNIPLRIALGMTENQSQAFLGFKNNAAKNLKTGIAVYNHNNGDPSANKMVNVNLLEENDLTRLVENANNRYKEAEIFERLIG